MKGNNSLAMAGGQLQGAVTRMLNHCNLRWQQQVELLDLGFGAQILLECTQFFLLHLL